MLASLPDLDKAILYHIENNLGCSLNSIIWNMAVKYTSRRNPTWPTKKKDVIPYVERLQSLGSIIVYKRSIPNQADFIGYYPAGTLFHVYP
jgi:hypothetical protein